MRLKIVRIIVTGILLIAAYLITRSHSLGIWLELAIYLVPYLVISYDVAGEALEGIVKGDVFDEDFLMFIATVGAMCIGFLPNGEPQFVEAVFVMLFFQVGEVFEEYAEDRSRQSITGLMDLRPDIVHVVRGEELVSEQPEVVLPNDVIVVKPGERVPLDGIVTTGTSTIDTSALTGESMPREVVPGTEVLSGSINKSGVLTLRVTKSYSESTVAKILKLVESSANNKSRSETFIHRFARVYTPIVVIVALLLALVPPIFYGNYLSGLAIWGYRALAFLVVSCPCALVLSVPLTFFAGIGGAAHRGILVKGGNYLEALTQVTTVVLDKTGTITEGHFTVDKVLSQGTDATELVRLAAAAEQFSTHPLALALRTAAGSAPLTPAIDVQETAGQGVTATVAGHEIVVGNATLMVNHHVTIPSSRSQSTYADTLLYIAQDGKYLGCITFTDKIKSGAQAAIDALRRRRISQVVLLTGDNDEIARATANELQLDAAYANLLPTDKVAHIERIIATQQRRERTIFVGDGINDAPVLARADVGIAMGGIGSDAAIEAADVVIMNDQLSKIPQIIDIARHTVGIAMQNTYFAIGIKVLILVAVAVGILGSWALPVAVFGDVGVMVLAVINAMRALRV